MAAAAKEQSAGGVRGAGASFGAAALHLAEPGFVADSIVDGPGLRCVVFTQGCPHGCPGCHNPATHAFGAGQDVPLAEVYGKIKASPLCRAVTFSGGEPFCQAGPLALLAEKLRAEGYELTAYSGYTFEQLLAGSEEQRRLLALLDTLVDGPFVLAQKNLELSFRGSENQRILDVQKSLAARQAVWETAVRWVF